MAKTDKTTEASKVELTDEALDGAQGGASMIKMDDLDTGSKGTVWKSRAFDGKGNDLFQDKAGTLDKSSTKLKY